MRWKTRRGKRLWAATSPRTRLFLGIGVFCVFATFGVLLDVPRQAHVPLPYLALYAFLMGLMAVCYAFALLWDQRLLPIGIALLLLNSSIGEWVSRPGRGLVLSPAATHARLRTDTIVSIALIALGYVFLIRFIHSLARRHANLSTEVELARAIHDALVPAVSGSTRGVEFYGRSQPSGAIGGDLVDAIEGPQAIALYVVDVAGHGVQAGVLMAMLKSAARTTLAGGGSLPAMLAHFNRTICELERPGIFATCAALRVGAAGGVEYALAGHPPIFMRCARSGVVRELDAAGPPLGLDAAAAYASAPVDAAPGDEFLIVTDGLSEVFGKGGRELGLPGVRDAAFADGAAGPRDIAERVIAAAARFGRQLDDQTVLAIRMLPG
jgi:phosphoserine phosphatase RsbU/P